MANSLPPKPRTRWLLWLVGLAVWTVALLMPLPIERGTGLRHPDVLFTTAKLTHLLGYSALAGLGAWLTAHLRQRLLILAGLIAHAAVTEWLQSSFPALGRTGSVRDALLDGLGIGLGMGIVAVWQWRGAERKKQTGGPGSWSTGD